MRALRYLSAVTVLTRKTRLQQTRTAFPTFNSVDFIMNVYMCVLLHCYVKLRSIFLISLWNKLYDAKTHTLCWNFITDYTGVVRGK